MTVRLFYDGGRILVAFGWLWKKSHASSCSARSSSGGGRRQNDGGMERPTVHFCGLTPFIHQPSPKKKPFTASSASSFTVIPSPPPQSLLCALTSRISASLSHDIHIDVPSLSVLEQSCTAKIPNGVALHAIIQSYCEARCRWSQERYKF